MVITKIDSVLKHSGLMEDVVLKACNKNTIKELWVAVNLLHSKYGIKISVELVKDGVNYVVDCLGGYSNNLPNYLMYEMHPYRAKLKSDMIVQMAVEDFSVNNGKVEFVKVGCNDWANEKLVV